MTDERAAGEAEIERRAARYGLPPLAWPEGWPVNSLQAMRAATWATEQGAGAAFARAAYRREFAEGRGLGPDVLREAAEEAGLDPAALLAATSDERVKLALRRATEAAWERGVQGVPTLEAGGRLYFGDDRLEASVH
jgi:2-hydroxychromene-2-carboxylate isomerase